MFRGEKKKEKKERIDINPAIIIITRDGGDPETVIIIYSRRRGYAAPHTDDRLRTCVRERTVHI